MRDAGCGMRISGGGGTGRGEDGEECGIGEDRESTKDG